MISLILSAPAVKREQKRQAICIAILFNENSFSDTKIEKKKKLMTYTEACSSRKSQTGKKQKKNE